MLQVLKYCIFFVVLPIKCEEDSYHAAGRDPNEPVPPYYPGTEISGYMPHRGDFTVVSSCCSCLAGPGSDVDRRL